jgi:hypothetical protein
MDADYFIKTVIEFLNNVNASDNQRAQVELQFEAVVTFFNVCRDHKLERWVEEAALSRSTRLLLRTAVTALQNSGRVAEILANAIEKALDVFAYEDVEAESGSYEHMYPRITEQTYEAIDEVYLIVESNRRLLYEQLGRYFDEAIRV